jgi:hypothetical protein
MIAYMNGTWVDLGPEHPRSLRRAGRLLRKGVIHALTLEQPVTTALWVAGARSMAFGDLMNAGLMVRTTERGSDPENFAVRWTVIEKVSFVDNYGHRWVYGTTDLWES